jgi:hypothetical protein
MNLRLLRLIATLGVAAGAIGLAVVLASPSALSRSSALGHPIESAASMDQALTDGDNRLINPDFENGYTYPLLCCNNIAVPVGWNVRWYTDTAIVIENITYTFKQPEVKIIDNSKWPFDGTAPNIPPRIHSGRYAVDSFALFAPQDTTFYQQVGHLPLGAVVTGSAWLHAWVSSCNPFPQSATIQLPAVSLQDTNDPDNDYRCADGYWPIATTHMMIGLDPFGGTDPRAASVVWNWNEADPAWWGPYDYYSPTLPVTVTAQSYTVTLFLRGVTRQPTRYDDLYFDAASLTYSFPLHWQIDQGAEWPLATAITIGLQTPLSLTQAAASLQDPNGDPVSLESLGSTASAPYTLSWRFVPAADGAYRFTLTAHELPDPLVKPIEVRALPFAYEQDHVLSSGTLSAATSITAVLSAPLTLTNLAASVADPQNGLLTTTLVSSAFNAGWYNFAWQFTAAASGWHTITFNADDFTQPYARRVLVAATRSYLPVIRSSAYSALAATGTQTPGSTPGSP